jgi:hypothetical protein
MDKTRISVASKEYVRAHITVTKDGAPFNPTVDSVHFAFTATEDLTGTITWNTGSWETDSISGKRYARCLVGPGAVVLAKGTFVVHVRVTDDPQIPAIKAGIVEIY